MTSFLAPPRKMQAYKTIRCGEEQVPLSFEHLKQIVPSSESQSCPFSENTSGLNKVLSARLTPWDLLKVPKWDISLMEMDSNQQLVGKDGRRVREGGSGGEGRQR
jgi:hypothetical protein